MVVNDKLHYNNSHSIYSLMCLPVLSLSLLPTLLSVVVLSCLCAFQRESCDHSIFPRGWLIYISGTWESILVELMASLSTKLLLVLLRPHYLKRPINGEVLYRQYRYP